MAERKLDLPDDLLSTKPSDHSWNPKVEASGSDEGKLHVGLHLHDETKDQLASESSIPLSPQWLYSKPSESKMDVRTLGNTNDGSQKEGWRLDGTDDKKDWRRIATENESSRRWREEERETGLLGARRDRRKTDRRVENVSVENRVLPSSDRWHDGNNRNSGHEARRDSKWSSRWGPDDKEKESRVEKKTDVEKEKEEAHNDNQLSIVSNRSVSERESDSRDKWRPRHRMEVHSSGSTSHRAAPGFGLERGRGEGSNLGFAVGRGRSNAIGRGTSAGSSTASQLYKSGSVIGKPSHTLDSFCYPRGKLLDIYRRQKLDSSYTAMPEEMEESLPLTQDCAIEPLAFVAPDVEEEAVLSDIWKGKITSSGVAYNSFSKGRSAENVTGVGECESFDEKLGVIPSDLSEETSDPFHDAASNGAYQTDDDDALWKNSRSNILNEKGVGHEEGNKVTADGAVAAVFEGCDVWSTKEISTSLHADSRFAIGENGQTMNSALREHFHSDGVDSVCSFDFKSKLPDDSNSLFLPSSDEDHSSTMSHLAGKNEAKDLERNIPLEDLYFCYIDPHGTTQGPFLGADILLWFEEGYFGTDLPVRMSDAPEGTPFQSLGEVMPGLKFKAGCTSSELEQSDAVGGKLEPDLHLDSLPEKTDSTAVNELYQPLSDLNSHSVQHSQSRTSEPEIPVQLPHSEGQSFHDFVAQDEEIVFPGRPGSSGYSTTQSSRSALDSLSISNGLPSLPNELTEPGLPYQSDNKLHPFGLFWSELEGTQTRQSESSSDLSSSVGRSTAFGAMSDPVSVPEKWADAYRQDMHSVPNSFQDAAAARHLPLVEQEPNHVDLAEQLMSRKFQQQQQQQLQQRNMLSSHSHLNESLLEHVPSQNLIHHQQLANHSVSDLEHLLALQQLQQQQLQQQQLQQQQLQQQRQLQLQQQQLQQQFHQQQKLLQERQQSQARQVLLDQLLHGQIPDPGLPQSRVDPMRATVLDQVLLEQQLLHELQQRSHYPQRHFVPSVEQLAQAKFGQTPQQDQQRDLYELLSHGQHGQMQSLERQILQEQLQARQLSMGLRPRINVEEERHIDSLWPVNENDHFLRGLAANPRSHSSGISPLDFYQRQQRTPHEDQLSQLERNLSFQDRLRQGIYEPGSMPFERSLSLPAGASGMNMDIVNAMAHAHGLDIQELSSRMQSAGQVGTLSSGSHPHNPHHPIVPNQFHVPYLDPIESRWPESSGPLSNDWMESRMQQLHIAERQKRESDTKMTSEDSNFWMRDGSDDDQSRRLLMELLHQKSDHQSADTLQLGDGLTFDKRLPSGLYPGSSSSEHHFNGVPDEEANMNNSFALGSYGSNVCEAMEVSSVGEQTNHLGKTDKSAFRSDSAATSEGHSSLIGISDTSQAALEESNFIDKLSANQGYLEIEGRKYVSKSQGMTRVPVTEIQNGIAEQAPLAATDRGVVPVNALSRRSSLSMSGFFDDKIGPQSSFTEDTAINQVPVLSKASDNILLRRPPVARASASQEGLSELGSDAVRGKSSTGVEGANPVNPGADLASGKKDVRFRRTSSCGDADVSEPSFIDMLKSNAKKNAAPDVHMTATGSESSDAAQGGRSGKKKGKKGRQIDPALLGFKVTSNRIMMGEIQRIED